MPAHHSSPHPQPLGCLGLPWASLTTLSSGTERLRVHSWLFTKESAGEKAACQDWGGTHTFAIDHPLLLTLPLHGPRPENSTHALVSWEAAGTFCAAGTERCQPPLPLAWP